MRKLHPSKNFCIRKLGKITAFYTVQVAFSRLLAKIFNWNWSHITIQFETTILKWRRTSVPIVKFQYISHLFLVFLLLNLSIICLLLNPVKSINLISQTLYLSFCIMTFLVPDCYISIRAYNFIIFYFILLILIFWLSAHVSTPYFPFFSVTVFVWDVIRQQDDISFKTNNISDSFSMWFAKNSWFAIIAKKVHDPKIGML